MKRLFPLLALMLLGVAPAAHATAPSTTSIQGVLTDNLGNLVPDGNYNLEFNLYTVPVAGASLWTETHPVVAVSLGGFSVILGSINPLSLAFGDPLYLGVKVNGGPELAPRIPLTSSPYALSLRLPYASGANSPGPVLELRNSGAGPAILADPWLQIGHVGGSSHFEWHGGGAADAVGTGFGYAGLGGALFLQDETGAPTHIFEPDFDGSGAWMVLEGGNGLFEFDGNGGFLGSPFVFIGGAASGTWFDTNISGDPAVALPNDAVSAVEVLDEPGIAQGHVNGDVDVPGAMGDIVTVSITTPAPGYIVVEADGQHRLGGDGTNANYANFQIDETAGGAVDNNHYFASGSSPSPAITTRWTPISIRRTYFMPAGAYTFRLEGTATNPAALTNAVWNPTMTATYYPTSYGAVTTAPTLAEAGEFSQVRMTSSGPNLPGDGGRTGQLVDLRELESRVARAQADVVRAQRALFEARSAQQRDRSARLRAEQARARTSAAAPAAGN